MRVTCSVNTMYSYKELHLQFKNVAKNETSKSYMKLMHKVGTYRKERCFRLNKDFHDPCYLDL